MQLHEWQDVFQRNILCPDTELRNKMLPWLNPTGASPEKRLGVYIDAYVLRLTETLRSNYPALHQLLGDNDFEALSRRYLSIYPSAHASIRWFGDRLAALLKDCEPYSGIPSLSELADFEWALRHTIDAADHDSLVPDDLQAIEPGAWAELSFNLHPSLTILRLDWNVIPIWRALSDEISSNRTPPKPVLQPGLWLIYRQPDLVSAWRSTSPLEIAALEGVRRGLTFADQCEELGSQVRDIETVPQIAATFLRAWAEQGLLAFRQGH